jgi:amidase
MKGSVCGIGTDIAGSIRIPAYCNGTFGFRPSSGRIPYGRQASSGREGMTGILPVAGPLTRSIRDAAFIMKSVLDTDPWLIDENVISVPWRPLPSPSSQKTLTLGLLTEDPSFPVHPTVLRALTTASTALKQAGHTIIPLTTVPSLMPITKLAWKFFMLDPRATAFANITASGEPFIPSIATTAIADLADHKPTLDGLFDINVERRQICAQFRKIYVENSLDAIIMPVAQWTAPPHDTYGIPPYTVLANVIDYPAASVPFLKADGEKDKDFVREVEYGSVGYEAETFEGAPAGIQVMGRPMRDEELARDLEVIGSVIFKD